MAPKIDAHGNVHADDGKFSGTVGSPPSGSLDASAGEVGQLKHQVHPTPTSPVANIPTVRRYRSSDPRTAHPRFAAEAGRGNMSDPEGIVEEFDRNNPDATNADIALYLCAGLPPLPDDVYGDKRWELIDSRADSVAELSERLADGQAGTLVDVEALRPGDRLDLSRLMTDDTATPAMALLAASSHPTPDDRPDIFLDDGGVCMRVGGNVVVLPAGCLVPVVSVNFRGVQYTERELVSHLVDEGVLTEKETRRATYPSLGRAISTPVPHHEVLAAFAEHQRRSGLELPRPVI